MRYKVIVRETLEREVEVNGDDHNEAIDKIKERYYNEDIVLDADDHVGTEFIIKSVEEI